MYRILHCKIMKINAFRWFDVINCVGKPLIEYLTFSDVFWDCSLMKGPPSPSDSCSVTAVTLSGACLTAHLHVTEENNMHQFNLRGDSVPVWTTGRD